jgi:hypothetical protein
MISFIIRNMGARTGFLWNETSTRCWRLKKFFVHALLMIQ